MANLNQPVMYLGSEDFAKFIKQATADYAPHQATRHQDRLTHGGVGHRVGHGVRTAVSQLARIRCGKFPPRVLVAFDEVAVRA